MQIYIWGAVGFALGVVTATICLVVAAVIDDRRMDKWSRK